MANENRGLTAFWIEGLLLHGPPGIGVTAHHLEDALGFLHILGYSYWFPDDPSMLQITEGITVAELNPYFRDKVGPTVVRGVWFPFTDIGVPKWADELTWSDRRGE